MLTENVALTDSVIATIRQRYVSIELQTTGTTSRKERIVEIGVVRFDKGRMSKAFNASHINDESTVSQDETDVYANLVAFISDVLKGETIVCMYDAQRSIKILADTLSCLGYNGIINYVDTRAIATIHISHIVNYKPDTLANYYKIKARKSHRAYDDAETIGKILWNLLDTNNITIQGGSGWSTSRTELTL